MGWDGRSDDDSDDDDDGSGSTLALDVINRRVWSNGPTRSGDDDDDGIGSPCHRGCVGHINRRALDVHDVVGAAYRGSPRFNAKPPVPARYRCQCAPVICTGMVCAGTGAVSGNQTRGIPVQCLTHGGTTRNQEAATHVLSYYQYGYMSRRHRHQVRRVSLTTLWSSP